MTPDVGAIEFTEFRTAADLESIYVKDAAELTAATYARYEWTLDTTSLVVGAGVSAFPVVEVDLTDRDDLAVEAGTAFTLDPIAFTYDANVGVEFAPVNFALAEGSTLPAGVTLDVTTGELSGTVSDAGAYAFSLTATDALGNRVVGEYVLTASEVAPELTINLSVHEVQQGEQLVIRGGGFVAGEDVSAVVRSTPVTLAPGVADANGDVVFTFNTPADFALGAHTVTLTGATSGEIVSAFTVVAALNQEGEGTPEAETQPEETLPVTGASGTGLLGAGTGAAALVLAGLSLMLWRRRVA